MTRTAAKGQFQAAGQIIPNQLTPAAFNLIGALLSRTIVSGGFASIQIARDSGEAIATAGAVFTFAPTAPELGCIITGQSLFQSSEVTHDVHFLRLLDLAGEVIGEAELPSPLPAGTGFVVKRQDTFTAA